MNIQQEWTPRPGAIPAISIAQPFATAIIRGKKTIELRSWQTHYRGQIALHAGKLWYGQGTHSLDYAIGATTTFMLRHDLPMQLRDYPLGAIIGTARLVKCAHFTPEGYERLRGQHLSNATWEPGEYGWQFAEVQPLPIPVRYRGQLGLFGVELSHLELQEPMATRKEQSLG